MVRHAITAGFHSPDHPGAAELYARSDADFFGYGRCFAFLVGNRPDCYRCYVCINWQLPLKEALDGRGA
jgi:hypothetical protein